MKNTKLKSHLTLLATLSILIVFFVFPIITSVAQSLGYFPELGLYDITFDYYKEVFSTEGLLQSVGFTIYYSFTASVIAVAVGVFFAFIFYTNDRSLKAEKIVQLPILTPHLISTLIIYLFFSQGGIIARICYHIGFIEEPSQFIPLTQDTAGMGIILTYLWKGIPFVLITIQSVLRSTNAKLSLASENLGASKMYTFFTVVLPVAIPSIITSFLLLFAFSFGAFETPFLLGPTSPKSLPILAYNYYTGSQLTHRVYAMVINVLITVFCFILLMIYLYVDKKRQRYNIDSQLPITNNTVVGKNIARVICGVIIVSFVPLFIWAFSQRWQWPLLLPENYSLRSVKYLLSDGGIFKVVFDTVLLSLSVTVATLIITIPTAKILANSNIKLKGLWYALIWAPIIIPVTTIGMGMYSTMLKLGIQDSFIGVLIANVIPCIPYAMLILQSPCELIGDRYEKQASMLGECSLKTIFTVTLPILAPAIKTASVMVFMVSFGQYFLTFLIGGGLIKTLPIVMFPYVQQGDRVLSSIYSIVYISTILLITSVIEKTFNKYSYIKIDKK